MSWDFTGSGTSPPHPTHPRRENRVLESLLELPEIERVTFLHLEYVGPGKVLLTAAVDLTGDESEQHVARRLRSVATGIESRPQVERAILTLSLPEEPTLTVGSPSG